MHFNRFIGFFFISNKAKKTSQIASKIDSVYRNDARIKTSDPKWFVRLRIGNFDFEDRKYSGRITVIGDDQIETLINDYTSHVSYEHCNAFETFLCLNHYSTYVL